MWTYSCYNKIKSAPGPLYTGGLFHCYTLLKIFTGELQDFFHRAHRVDLDEVAHYEPPHQDQCSFQIPLFSSLVLKELNIGKEEFIQ